MSAALLGLAFKAKLGDSKTRKLVLLKLVDCCNDEGANIYPSLATVADEAVCSTQQVRRVLRDFCAVGLLRKVSDGGRGAGSTAHYALDIDKLALLRRPDYWTALEAAAGCAIGDDGEATDEAAAASDEVESVPAAGAPEPNKGDTMSPLHGGRVTFEGNKGDIWSHPTPYLEPSKIERERGRGRASGLTGKRSACQRARAGQ